RWGRKLDCTDRRTWHGDLGARNSNPQLASCCRWRHVDWLQGHASRCRNTGVHCGGAFAVARADREGQGRIRGGAGRELLLLSPARRSRTASRLSRNELTSRRTAASVWRVVTRPPRGYLCLLSSAAEKRSFDSFLT